jgi:hypothetical protein
MNTLRCLRLLLFKIPVSPSTSHPDHPCPGLAIRAIPEPFSRVPYVAILAALHVFPHHLFDRPRLRIHPPVQRIRRPSRNLCRFPGFAGSVTTFQKRPAWPKKVPG